MHIATSTFYWVSTLDLIAFASVSHSYRYFEERPAESFSASNTRILGLCTGLLAAAAVASARSLTDLIPLAVEAVRIAFRTGAHVSTASDALGQKSQVRESWSTIVPGVTENAAQAAIDEFHTQSVCIASVLLPMWVLTIYSLFPCQTTSM